MKLLCFLLIFAGFLNVYVLSQDLAIKNTDPIKKYIENTLGPEKVNTLFDGDIPKKNAPEILRGYIIQEEKIIIPSALAAFVSALVFSLETSSPSNYYFLGATCTLGISSYFVSIHMPKFLAAKKAKDMITSNEKKTNK